MRYLVTGGAGFIGSHIVERLVQQGAEVTVLDDLSTGKREHLRAVRERIRFIRGNVARLEACRRAMQGVDCVFHLAAVTSVPQSTRNPVAAHHTNVTGTLNILLAARDAHVQRVVYSASTAAYGDAAESPQHEALLPLPLSTYAAAKLAGEAYCQAFWRTHGLETVALRYFNVFGPRQNLDSQYGAVVPLFIAAALRGEPPTIFGDGSQTRDFVFVSNVVDANLAAAHAPAAGVAGGVQHRMRNRHERARAVATDRGARRCLGRAQARAGTGRRRAPLLCGNRARPEAVGLFRHGERRRGAAPHDRLLPRSGGCAHAAQTVEADPRGIINRRRPFVARS